ncbi:hypothetical protein AVEN_209353-1 [Araneus ventricosus]|uniref:Uncharacterized protein n=1 Tax=Araneus ventricosus TaxID=182803 RepID=A0A4Y2SHV7_ARAVE|nr:hypothetical protein AVEN_180499-1 [Araneus ventricosus]GBN87199.1 hypothetical protein AVEN_209353-1 [Araneus ventricosus]
MASRNTSLSSKSSDYSEIDDLPIVPPQPVPQKECKEIVPDISMVSDIVDNGSPLLPTPNNFLHANINHTSYQQRGNKSCISKTGMDITEITNAILDRNAGIPVMTYLNPGCQSCIINHAVMTNKGYNGQYALPKTSASILLPVGNEQSDKEMRFKSVDGEVNSNKTCHKHIELNVTASSNRKSIACNHAQLSCPLNSNEPERFQTEDIPNHYCSKDQHSKLRKSLSKYERPVSSDSRLGESRKSEETCEKETVDKNKLKDMHIMCPACFRKPCTCNFSAKEYNANPNASSDALSSIWEYLKQQDEKIDSINEKVLNFLSQHASCLIDQPSKGNEFSNATESDIPYILNILEVHSDKIREIQDQINLLKSSEHISSPANNNKIDESILNQAQTINCVNTETCKEEIHCPHSHNAVCCEQKQKITKTSTSTMTSLVIETNDKFVYHKQKTVVSGMREKKESSCLPNEHDSPTMKKHLDGENVNSNSQKRKSHKLNNCSPSLKCKQNLSSNSSSDVPDPNDNQVFKISLKR